MSSEGELDSCRFGGFGGVIGEGEMHGLGASCSGGGILHRFECLHKGGVTKVGLAFVAVHAVEEGRDFKKLEARVHEVEVLDFLLRWHVKTIGSDCLLRNARDVLVEFGVEFRERFAELIEFGGGAVDFKAVEFGKGEGFFDARSNVFEVAENSGGSDVGFAAEDLVSTDGKVIVETGVLSAGSGDEFLHGFFEVVDFPRLNFKIWIDANGL